MISKSAVVLVMLMFFARVSCDCKRVRLDTVICKSIPVFSGNYINDTWEYGRRITYLEIANDGSSLDLTSSTFVNMPNLKAIWIKSSNLTTTFGGSFKNLALNDLYLFNDSLEFIKKDTFTDLPVSSLSLSYNVISEIEDGAFRNLTNLETLRLDNNKLTSVHPHRFISNPEVLVTLRLENNLFKSITANMFKRLKNLSVLNLGFNQIEMIEENAFAHTPNLVVLHLRYNNLKEIDGKIFPLTGMTSLKLLLLDHNRLMYVSSSLLFRLANLKYITVLGNPWFCKCLDFFQRVLVENSIEEACHSEFFSENRPMCVVDRVDYCLHVYNKDLSDKYLANERNLPGLRCDNAFYIQHRFLN